MTWLVVLYFLVPSHTGAPLWHEASRHLVNLSSLSACNAYGAEQARRLRAATSTGHAVAHRCIEMPPLKGDA